MTERHAAGLAPFGARFLRAPRAKRYACTILGEELVEE
jgi:hypothetical protein